MSGPLKTPVERRDADRWLTVPNAITVLRLVVFAPLFVVLLLVADSPFWALIVLVVLGATDWVDGWVARRFNQVSEIGKALDPIADRISQIVVAGAMVVAGLLPIWMAVAVVAADVALGLTIVIGKSGLFPVRWLGRIRTGLLMLGLPAVLAVETFAPASDVLRLVALGIVGVGVVLHVITNVLYVRSILVGTAHEKRDSRGRRLAEGESR